MKQVRKCKYCGKEFVARSGMQKFCCEECQTKAKEARKKRQQDFMNAVEGSDTDGVFAAVRLQVSERGETCGIENQQQDGVCQKG